MLFHQNWICWQGRFDGYAISTTFVWIVEDRQSSEEVMVKFKETRRAALHIMMPQHQQAYIPVKDVYGPLRETLARIPPRTAFTHPSFAYPSAPGGRLGDVGATAESLSPGRAN